MFEDFRGVDLNGYLTKHRADKNQGLIKSNFLNEVEDVMPSVLETDELFKGWDRTTPYNEYLAKRRGENTKDNPLFKMINTEITKEEAVGTPEESLFKGLKEGQEIDLSSLLFKSQIDGLKDSKANSMWIDEHNQNVMLKTMSIVAPLYKKYVVDAEDSSDETLVKNLMENEGYDEEAAKAITAVFTKAKTKAESDN